jgi:hypothetical protein
MPIVILGIEIGIFGVERHTSVDAAESQANEAVCGVRNES